MNRNLLLLLFFVLTGIFQGCNTLYNTKVIEIQVLVPGTARIPKDYTKLAVKYNNSNIAFNPAFASYFEDTTHFSDTRNLDSIASLIYFDVFTDFASRLGNLSRESNRTNLGVSTAVFNLSHQ